MFFGALVFWAAISFTGKTTTSDTEAIPADVALGDAAGEPEGGEPGPPVRYESTFFPPALRVEAETKAVAEEVRAELAERQLERVTTQLAQERTRQEDLARDLQAARDRENQTTEVLEDRARLDRLTQAKPGLIERQARRATTRVWQDIEADSRE